MKVYTSLDDFECIDRAVLTLGMYDGVHLAHREVLRVLTDKARELEGESVVISFDPHPRQVLSGTLFPQIMTRKEKQELLETAGVDIWICLPFTLELASLSAEDFLTLLNAKMGLQHVVLGYNHGFGKHKEGNADTLSRWKKVYRFGMTEVPQLKLGNVEISSSVIRKSLIEGDVEIANRLLGYSYYAYFNRTEDTGNGMSAEAPAEKLLPAPGRYLCLWKHRTLEIEIDTNQKVGLPLGISPEEEDWATHPFYFRKHYE